MLQNARPVFALTLATLTVCLALAQANDAPKTADKDLDGKWVGASILRYGQGPPQGRELPSITFDGDKGTGQDGDFVSHVKIKIDATKTPKTMDLIQNEGKPNAETFLAIYEIKDDELRICSADPGKDRPTEFTSTGKNKYTLSVYKLRKK